jgi:hypothetical protein
MVLGQVRTRITIATVSSLVLTCSKFKFCFAVHDTVYEYEFTMFSVLCLYLVLSCSKFNVLCLLSHNGVSQVLHFGFLLIDW